MDSESPVTGEPPSTSAEEVEVCQEQLNEDSLTEHTRQIIAATNSSNTPRVAPAKVIRDHFAYLAWPGCWSSNSW